MALNIKQSVLDIDLNGPEATLDPYPLYEQVRRMTSFIGTNPMNSGTSYSTPICGRPPSGSKTGPGHCPKDRGRRLAFTLTLSRLGYWIRTLPRTPGSVHWSIKRSLPT